MIFMLPATGILIICSCVAHLYCMNSIRHRNISISQYLNIKKVKNVIFKEIIVMNHIDT